MSATMTAAKCAHCGKAFTPARRDAVTCSKLCRQRRWRAGIIRAREVHEAATWQLVEKCRAEVRDGSALDGLAPFGVQAAIRLAEGYKESVVADLLWKHRRTDYPNDGRVKCICGWSSDRQGLQQHQASVVVEALACL